MLTPPQGNIFRENPRKVMLGGAIFIAGAFLFHGPSSGLTYGGTILFAGIISLVIGFACWIGENRYQMSQELERANSPIGQVSIGRLFAAGFLPAFMLWIALATASG